MTYFQRVSLSVVNLQIPFATQSLVEGMKIFYGKTSILLIQTDSRPIKTSQVLPRLKEIPLDLFQP